jgi:hypothetical protein
MFAKDTESAASREATPNRDKPKLRDLLSNVIVLFKNADSQTKTKKGFQIKGDCGYVPARYSS